MYCHLHKIYKYSQFTMLYTGVLCTWVKLLTGLQILGCVLHKNAPGPAGGAIALPKNFLGVIKGKERRGGKGKGCE